MRKNFPLLSVISNYSMLYGPHTVKELLSTASDRGFSTAAITDINNVYGIHEFINEAALTGITPLFGSKVSYRDESAVILARNREGFSSLCRIITAINAKSENSLKRILFNFQIGITVLAKSESLLDPAFECPVYAAMPTPFDSIAKKAHEKGFKVAAVPEVVFLNKDAQNTHQLLRAIGLNKNFRDIKKEELAPDTSFMPDEDVIRQFSDMSPESVKNSVDISESIELHSLFNGFIFPSYKGQTVAESAVELRERTFAGALKRYTHISDTVRNRLNYELDIITSMGFAAYFLIVADIVSLSSGSCGRGSGAASAVAYSLGITNIDPIKHNLYFERFLNPERKDPPDIDLDFAWDERGAIIDRVMETFGKDNCAMVCEHLKFRRRSAMRETARAFGIPDIEISDSNLRNGTIWKKIERAALRIKGFPRNLSVHSGGVIITPGNINDYVPTETASGGMKIISWEKDGAEEAGLVKIDLLGNRSLAVIRDAVNDLKRYNIHIDRLCWNPEDDEDTVDLLARGDSMGVFYVESPAMRQLQKKTGKGDFEHLVIHSSIIRPAANSYINQYIERLKGRPYKALHPALENMLSDTYGIMCYQEDVSRTAVLMAGFPVGMSEKLRKIISKKDDTILDKFKNMFIEGCIKNNVSESVATEVWDMISSFSGYSFCKPHSASYAKVSFQSAYLKAHYPAQFIAAVISNNGGFYSTQSYVSEALRIGVIVLNPDINRSSFNFTTEGMRSVRVGFNFIRDLSITTVKKIIGERSQNGDFRSLENFSKRVYAGDADLTTLVKAGVFDEISGGLARSDQLMQLLVNSQKPSGELMMFEEDEPLPVIKRTNRSTEKILRQQFSSLGFLTDRHPLFLYRNELKSVTNRVFAEDLKHHVRKAVTLAGWPVALKFVPTKDKKIMAFYSFDDETALFETVIFPNVFDRYRHLLDMKSSLIISGTVENDHGALQIVVELVKRL